MKKSTFLSTILIIMTVGAFSQNAIAGETYCYFYDKANAGADGIWNPYISFEQPPHQYDVFEAFNTKFVVGYTQGGIAPEGSIAVRAIDSYIGRLTFLCGDSKDEGGSNTRSTPAKMLGTCQKVAPKYCF